MQGLINVGVIVLGVAIGELIADVVLATIVTRSRKKAYAKKLAQLEAFEADYTKRAESETFASDGL